MTKPRKPRTKKDDSRGYFPSNFPVPVHSQDFWKFDQELRIDGNLSGYVGDGPKYNAAAEARAEQIRALPGADLQAFCTPAELAGELSRRQYFAQMNQTELDFQSTFDPDAAAEAKRRTGVYPR